MFNYFSLSLPEYVFTAKMKHPFSGSEKMVPVGMLMKME